MNFAYIYDGSFEGALCCVFEAYEKKETPIAIVSVFDEQQQIFALKEITTDKVKARRVLSGLAKKVCTAAVSAVHHLFLTCEPEKELLMISYIRMAFKVGRKIEFMVADPLVARVNKAIQHLGGEAHLYTGFVRFSNINGVLVAQIEPKNYVLPILAPHFCVRFNAERFLIHDKTHGQALVYQNRRHEIFPLSQLELATPDETEKDYRGLWKMFFETIAIEERKNPVCQRGHMPKRYWNMLTEMDPANDYGKIKEVGKSREQKVLS